MVLTARRHSSRGNGEIDLASGAATWDRGARVTVRTQQFSVFFIADEASAVACPNHRNTAAGKPTGPECALRTAHSIGCQDSARETPICARSATALLELLETRDPNDRRG